MAALWISIRTGPGASTSVMPRPWGFMSTDYRAIYSRVMCWDTHRRRLRDLSQNTVQDQTQQNQSQASATIPFPVVPELQAIDRNARGHRGCDGRRLGICTRRGNDPVGRVGQLSREARPVAG